MPTNPKENGARTIVCLLIGAGAGACAMLYLHKSRAEPGSLQPHESAATSSQPQAPGPGDILLFHNARGLNRLITRFTRSPFYHAALYAGDGNTVEARTPGVVRQDLRGREGDFIVVPAPGGKGRSALAWAETQVGDSYDFKDIGLIILDRMCRFLQFNYTPHGKYSCGEFVAVAFQKAGAPIFPKRDLTDVVPGDFAHLAPATERNGAG